MAKIQLHSRTVPFTFPAFVDALVPDQTIREKLLHSVRCDIGAASKSDKGTLGIIKKGNKDGKTGWREGFEIASAYSIPLRFARWIQLNEPISLEFSTMPEPLPEFVQWWINELTKKELEKTPAAQVKA